MALSIVIAQKNWNIGDIEGNASRIIEEVLSNQQHDLILFSELALCGYFPEDLIFRPDFRERCEAALTAIKQTDQRCGVILGHPVWQDGVIYNSLSFFYQGKRLVLYHKQKLPNHDVFDEKRYFACGRENGIVDFKGYRFGFLICEDLWQAQSIDKLILENIDLLISINASPYDYQKIAQREKLIFKQGNRLGIPIVYVNQVGAQDELVFDGQSFIADKYGEIAYRLPAFVEKTAVIHLNDQLEVENSITFEKSRNDHQIAEIYDALVLSIKDYVLKNGFKAALLGLSGGIDSALTLAIAVDALGKDNVRAVMMPFRYTSEVSIVGAREEAKKLGVKFDIISIEPIFDAFIHQLKPFFEGKNTDATEENLQARCRAVILMALSNKYRSLVLTTGNKSEMAVGYTTLYGDMAGGFSVLKDVPKTLVFALAHFRNSRCHVIPDRVLTRVPSAELAPNQKDEDTLPPYEILDGILRGYIEEDLSVKELISLNYDEKMVKKIIKLVDTNEYKRRQSAIGPKITKRNFGKGRRYPITSGFGLYNYK